MEEVQSFSSPRPNENLVGKKKVVHGVMEVVWSTLRIAASHRENIGTELLNVCVSGTDAIFSVQFL